MMGPKQEAQRAFFYEFSIEDHVPCDHVLRTIDGVIDLSGVRQHLSEFYSTTGRPSIDPELMMRMLLVGYAKPLRACLFRHKHRRVSVTPAASQTRVLLGAGIMTTFPSAASLTYPHQNRPPP